VKIVATRTPRTTASHSNPERVLPSVRNAVTRRALRPCLLALACFMQSSRARKSARLPDRRPTRGGRALRAGERLRAHVTQGLYSYADIQFQWKRASATRPHRPRLSVLPTPSAEGRGGPLAEFQPDISREPRACPASRKRKVDPSTPSTAPSSSTTPSTRTAAAKRISAASSRPCAPDRWG